MKHSTSIKALALVAALTTASLAYAGDGTKENPYTVAELNAQKAALATSGATVWVKADLKGLGEDGTLNENTESNQMAGLFGDTTGDFVAYSYQILQGLAMSDLTNTKDLLISLTYGETVHKYGNSSNPQYATDYEKNAVSGLHFSLEEVHGALSLTINGGYRGYHIQSCYVVPKEIVAARVSSGYTSAKGATISYGYYDGAEEEKSYIIGKNTALVLLAYDGTYDFVLSAGYIEQINSTSLSGGTQAGANVGTGNQNTNRWRFRFVNSDTQTGFERNSDDNATVILESKDEIFLTVNSKDNHFAGNWTWETTDKKWISWAGKNIVEFENHTSGIHEVKSETTRDENCYDLQGRRVANTKSKGLYITNGKKYIAK